MKIKDLVLRINEFTILEASAARKARRAQKFAQQKAGATVPPPQGNTAQAAPQPPPSTAQQTAQPAPANTQATTQQANTAQPANPQGSKWDKFKKGAGEVKKFAGKVGKGTVAALPGVVAGTAQAIGAGIGGFQRGLSKSRAGQAFVGTGFQGKWYGNQTGKNPTDTGNPEAMYDLGYMKGYNAAKQGQPASPDANKPAANPAAAKESQEIKDFKRLLNGVNKR